MSYQGFPPALMVLSPRLTKAGDPGASIVGIDTTPLADGAVAYCIENKLAYRLDKTSVAAPDGNLVLAPLNGPGRWLGPSASGPAGGDLAGTYPDPTVVAIEETSSPARLAIAGIPDGTVLARLGGTVVGITAHQSLVDVTDTTPAFLGAKISAGANILVTPVDMGGGNLVLVIAANVPAGTSDHKVLVDGGDTTAAFLAAKLAAGALIAFSILNPAANEEIEIGIAPSVTDGQAIITIGGVPTWSTNFQAQNLFTSGVYYAGSTVTNGEAAGSVVAVQTGSATLRGLVTAQHSTDVNGARLIGTKSRGTRAAPTTVVNGDTITRLVSAGYDGANYIPSAEISFEADAGVGAGSVPQKIVFRTGTSGSPTAKLSLFSSAATFDVQVGASMEVLGVQAIRALGVATPVASTGDLRLRSQYAVAHRNAANTVNVFSLLTDASNNLFVGDDSFTPTTQIRSSTTFQVNVGGATRLSVNTTRVEIGTPPELSFFRTIANPTITQQPSVVAGDGQRLWIRAQSVTAGGAAGSGGTLLLTGGAPDSGQYGRVQLGLNVDNTVGNVQTMVEAAQISTGNRVVALVRLSLVSSVQMPANTGDGVIYVADAVTVPTVDAATGHIYYSEQTRPAWRFANTNFRLNNVSATANAGAGAAVPATVETFMSVNVNGTTMKIPMFAA